jgi:phage terminase small subunit
MNKQLLLPGIPEKKAYNPDFPEAERTERLTAKQKAFVRHYLESHEITESAKKAGYADKHSNTIGNRLMHKSRIIELIRQEEEKAIQAAGINRKDALLRLAKMVYFDPRNLYREDGSVKDPSEWDDATAAVIAGIEVMEVFGGKGKEKTIIGQTKKVKVIDPLRALEVLMKHLGLLKDSDKDGNPMAPGTTIVQNKIVIEFVNAPGPDEAKNVAQGSEGEVIEGQEIKGD